jgi:histidyl-tRNA synthetase
MALSTQPYKGARDFYPEDYRKQRWMFDVCRKVLESYGYEAYDAPILEPLDLYLAKSGDEIVNDQTYAFEDRGGRKVVIRPEMTPTVSRMVAAKRQELVYPLRWYSIPNLWRYERPQRGRLREHWQLNADLFGVAGVAGDIELIQLADSLMKAFGAKPTMYKIRVNDRRFIDYILHDYLAFDNVQSQSIVKLIDRMHKIPRDEFIVQLDALCTPTQRGQAVVEQLLDVLTAARFTALPQKLQTLDVVKELQTTLQSLHDAGLTNAEFDSTLMRGFDYYTGLVFEVFDTHPDNNRSMFGGGRYDGLVGLFGVEPLPTVGFGMGDVTLANFLEFHQLVPPLHTETRVYVVLAGDVLERTQPYVQQLRKAGVNTAVDISGRNLDKQFRTADKKGIPFVLTVGENELESEQFKLKDMRSGKEETHSLARIISIVEDHRYDDADNDRD